MTVSIYDADLKGDFYYFNLDVMKVAAYYKLKKNELVVAATTFEPQKYSTNFYFQDGNQDHSDLGAALLKQLPNQIIYKGLAFTNDKYEPLPKQIELMEPDLNFYDSLENQNNKSFFKLQKNSCHLRLSYDGEELDSSKLVSLQDKNFKSYFLHDANLLQIKDVVPFLNKAGKRFRFNRTGTYTEQPVFYSKFPIHLNGLESCMQFNSINFDPNYIKIQFDGIMDYRVFKELGTTGFTKFQSLYYNITDKINFKQFLENFLQIYRQTIFIRNRKRNFLLIYDSNFFSEEVWSSFINMWTIFLQKSDKFTTFTDFWSESPPSLQNFKKIYPFFWQELKSCRDVSLKGGKLVNNDWTGN